MALGDWLVASQTAGIYMTSKLPRVGAVIVTDNSTEDLPKCLTGLMTQQGVDLHIILVVNDSRCKERATMEADFLSLLPSGRVLCADEACPNDVQVLPAIFLRNSVNSGYSAGNNIGTRVASATGCEAVLIINPDVHLSAPDYVANLMALITADERTAVACSAMRNLSGAQENPMFEPDLFEELLWPVKMFAVGLFGRSKPEPQLPSAPFKVEKVSGSCFLIRTDFLKKIGYFDQSVFLYCEEAILMVQVRSYGWHMIMLPSIEAVHAHQSTAKGDQLSRYKIWSDSRRYFHATYGEYGAVLQSLLSGTRWMTLALIKARQGLRNIRKKYESKNA